MNKNYPIYKTTFIDDMRSLVEEAAQNFPDSIAISYKDKPYDKEVTDMQEYFENQVRLLNGRMAPYKAVKRVKLRDVEFQKNTSRKITRFNIDKTID